MNAKAKMRIRTAVADYIRMFPREYQEFLKQIAQVRAGLKEDFATLQGTQAIQRQLTEIPEKLSVMIGKKLDDIERKAFTEKEHVRWFAKEFPQFSVTKAI